MIHVNEKVEEHCQKVKWAYLLSAMNSHLGPLRSETIAEKVLKWISIWEGMLVYLFPFDPTDFTHSLLN